MPLYGRLQKGGRQRRRWIRDPSRPNCYIKTNNLSLERLSNIPGVGFQLIPMAKNLPIGLKSQVMELDLPDEFHDGVEVSVYRSFDIQAPRFRWTGYTGPGIICLNNIGRYSRCVSLAPHISQISQVIYENDFPLDSLRHVLVTTVINHDTNGFITQELYRGRPIPEPQAWHIGTPAYDALLGTRIGGVVAYLVLGAFERGTRRIKSITIWPDTSGCPNLRFDIEPTS